MLAMRREAAAASATNFTNPSEGVAIPKSPVIIRVSNVGSANAWVPTVIPEDDTTAPPFSDRSVTSYAMRPATRLATSNTAAAARSRI